MAGISLAHLCLAQQSHRTARLLFLQANRRVLPLPAVHSSSFSNCFFAASIAFIFASLTSGYFSPSESIVWTRMFATRERATHLWLDGMTYHGASWVLVALIASSNASI